MKLCVCLFFVAVWAGVGRAQSNIAQGELHGVVTDPSDARVPGATVTVKNPRTGVVRTTQTDDRGEYRALLLPPGSYDVQFEEEGFRTHLAKEVRVTVGQIAILDRKLELGAAAEVIEVSAAPLLVEIERSHQANTLEQEAILDLPINRRDYLTFTLLAPGVVDATALADQADFRIKETPHSGFSFYASNGRRNSVTVDGGEANNVTGAVRSTLSQEAVQEFQINRSNYSAELGGASGGVINIVSKSGTNQTRGSLFSFFRDDSMDAGDPFARIFEGGRPVRTQPPSQRQQFGGTIGMPLRKDRTFVFGAFEGLLRNESAVSTLLNDPSIFEPTPGQQAVLSQLPSALAQPLRAALTASQSTRELFRVNSGVFPYTSRDWKYSVRLDSRMRDGDQFLFRFNSANEKETNASIAALAGASRGTEVKLFEPTALLGWTHTFSPRTLNDARLQYAYRNVRYDSLEKFGPSIKISGYGIFNRDLVLPNRTIERHVEIRDTVSHQQGSHILKAGGLVLVRGTHADTQIAFGGQFTFGSLPGSRLNPALPPSFALNALQAFDLGIPQTYIQGAGDPVVGSTNPFYAVFLQDSWKVRANLTLDIGLRYEVDTRKPPLPNDMNNVAPRFAFAWDPFGDKKTTVRGGYGIFHAPIYYYVDIAVNVLNIMNGRRKIAQAFTTALTPGPAAAPNIWQTLLRQGVISVPTPTRQLTPADMAQFGITFPQTGPLPPFALLYSNSPDFVNPYAQQASLSLEREIVPDLSASLGYTLVRSLKIERGRDKNLLPAPLDPQRGIRVWSNPLRDFVNPLLAQDNHLESTANALYIGMILEIKKRFSRSFSLNSNYTFSRATDDVVDFNRPFQPNDGTNLRAEHSLSSFDQRHKVVVYGLWSAPGALQVSPIFRANSARPFNLLVGFDLNQDRHDETDRPPFAGRNTGIGPNFWTLDLRLARKISLGHEARNVELIAEAFNLFNRLNFASINNTVGAISGPFNVQGRHDRTPSEPLGFTSAFPPRRIQLGVRLNF